MGKEVKLGHQQSVFFVHVGSDMNTEMFREESTGPLKATSFFSPDWFGRKEKVGSAEIVNVPVNWKRNRLT